MHIYAHPDRKPIMSQAYTEDQWQCALGFHEKCLGPLAKLIGTWEGEYGKSYSAVHQYALLAMAEGAALDAFSGLAPGQPTADFHSIKNQTYRCVGN
jgi:hypothetical protein